MNFSSTNPAPLTITLAITGASGARLLGHTMLAALEADARVGRIHLVASPAALRVFSEEQQPGDTPGARNQQSQLAEILLGHAPHKTRQHAHTDIAAPIASGSYAVDATIVLPCSMGTLAGIAHGLASNLVERAADVALKERRRLVLCVRETPLNLIHLRNMAAVTEAGASVFPVVPTFYNEPETVGDMARNYIHRVLAHIGLPQPGACVWGED